MIMDITIEQARTMAQAIGLDQQTIDTSAYRDALCVVGDISDEGVVEDGAARVLDRFGRVDALVNNAGISMIKPALDTPTETYRTVLDVNLVAPFMLCKAYGRTMIAPEGVDHSNYRIQV